MCVFEGRGVPIMHTTFTCSRHARPGHSAPRGKLSASDFYKGQRNLLRRIHADETLRGFFPTISHGAVRLRVEPLDGASRQLLVAELEGERYEVLRAGVPGPTWVEVPAGDLIDHLRAALNRP